MGQPCCRPVVLKEGPPASSLGVSWELLVNAGSPAPPQTRPVRTSERAAARSHQPAGDSDEPASLSTTVQAEPWRSFRKSVLVLCVFLHCQTCTVKPAVLVEPIHMQDSPETRTSSGCNLEVPQ